MRRAYPQATPLATGKRPPRSQLTRSRNPHNPHDLAIQLKFRERQPPVYGTSSWFVPLSLQPGFPS